MLGPQISISHTPTCVVGDCANAYASMEVNVDFPTPPFPERIRSLWTTVDMRAWINGRSGSGPLGAVAHIFWLGQLAQASPCPAFSDSGPGQCSGGFVTIWYSLGPLEMTYLARGLLVVGYFEGAP